MRIATIGAGIARGLFGALLAIIGATLSVGGAKLAWLGGSPYYVLAGLATLGSGIMIWRRDRRAGVLFAGLLLATLPWAVWEAGWDGWALTARLAGPLVLGLVFLLPALRPRGGRGWLVAVAALVVATPLAAVLRPADPPDPQFQAGLAQVAAARFARAPRPGDPTAGEWRDYGNDPGGTRFSALDQLTPDNVARLTPAWTARVGLPATGKQMSLEATPLKIGESLYTCTSYNDVLSLDAETGRINWRFVANVDLRGRVNGKCRGVAYFEVPGATGACARRILTNTLDARLIALDAATGRRCAGFGTNGQTDLSTGMGQLDHGYYFVTSAPQVVNGKVVLGGWVSDNQYWGEPSGVVRAYDAVTGRFAWAFDAGRPDDPREPAPGRTYTHSTPNSWAPMSADPALGLVYIPTGNATPDYFGGYRRPFDERFSSAVVALEAATGKVRWVFQTTHHDLWDYDVASQPTLVDIPGPRGIERALIQPTKRGELFLLDRLTGKPLAAVAERPAPQRGKVPEERLSPTQPFSVGMPSFAGPNWRERDMWGLTPVDQLWCRIKFRQARYDGPLTPPGLTPSIVYPGFLGGMDWGGVAVDPELGILVVNSSRVGNFDKLVPRKVADALGVTPSVGGGPRLSHGLNPQARTPYAASAVAFLSPLDVPCNEPPFGLISAIDLRTRKLLWSKPFGTAASSGPFGMATGLPIPIGLPNAGGAVVTRGGLVFIAATQEPVLHAFDIRTGREMWKVPLPAAGQATPMTYWSAKSGRQFVVVSAGGNLSLRAKTGDYLVAYALPRS